MTHTCHAIGCNKQTPRSLFMCYDHWGMVPNEMKKAISKTYIKGQEWGRAPVTQAYIDAAMTAQSYVSMTEGRITPEKHEANTKERESRGKGAHSGHENQ